MADDLLAAVRRYADSHVDARGIAATPIAGLTVMRATARSGLDYELAQPFVALVLQGSKHVVMGGRSFELDAGCSLLVAADVPTQSRITRASAADPHYSLALELDLAAVEELVAEMDGADAGSAEHVRVELIEREVADAALQLVRLLDRSFALPILRAQLVREMHYWLMAGRHGSAIRRLGERSVLRAQ
jgi:hypothetical protein